MFVRHFSTNLNLFQVPKQDQQIAENRKMISSRILNS